MRQDFTTGSESQVELQAQLVQMEYVESEFEKEWAAFVGSADDITLSLDATMIRREEALERQTQFSPSEMAPLNILGMPGPFAAYSDSDQIDGTLIGIPNLIELRKKIKKIARHHLMQC